MSLTLEGYSCHVLGEPRAAICVKSLPLVQPYEELCWVCLTLLLAPQHWLGVLTGARQAVYTNVRGHDEDQNQDVWHIWLPGTCGSQHAAESWKLLSIERKGKIGDAEA